MSGHQHRFVMEFGNRTETWLECPCGARADVRPLRKPFLRPRRSRAARTLAWLARPRYSMASVIGASVGYALAERWIW